MICYDVFSFQLASCSECSLNVWIILQARYPQFLVFHKLLPNDLVDKTETFSDDFTILKQDLLIILPELVN